MAMIVVSPEIGFARKVADRILMFDDGRIIGENAKEEFFDNSQEDRTKLFLFPNTA